jgi:hypothetical protein
MNERIQGAEASIVVETDIFEHREVKPHFINRCCFGEDFAAWLRGELTRSSGLDAEFSEPLQEDYGWGFWCTRGRERLFVSVSYVGDGPQEEPAQGLYPLATIQGSILSRDSSTRLTRKFLGRSAIVSAKSSRQIARLRQ